MGKPTAAECRLSIVVDLGNLVLNLGNTYRATDHQDGATRESDTTHTVMLAVVACAMAPAAFDVGRVAQLALVHDIVEAMPGVGDTDSYAITPGEKLAKSAKEAAGLRALYMRFDVHAPWLTDLIREYEAQVTPESRYVRFLDKAMPKITHSLNNGAAMRRRGETVDSVRSAHRDQLRGLADEYPEMHFTARRLLEDLMTLAEVRMAGEVADE